MKYKDIQNLVGEVIHVRITEALPSYDSNYEVHMEILETGDFVKMEMELEI